MLDRTGFGGGGGGGERGGGSGRGVAGPVDRAGRPSAAGGPELLCRLRRVTRQRLGCVSSFGRPAGPGGPPPLAVFAAPRHGPESLSASRLGIVVLDCGCYSVQTGMRWSGDTRVAGPPPPPLRCGGCWAIRVLTGGARARLRRCRKIQRAPSGCSIRWVYSDVSRSLDLLLAIA